MKITVLLSAGLHPVSGRPCPVPVELQAVRLAVDLAKDRDGDITGLHAGPNAAILRDALGHGLPRLEHIAVPRGSDPTPSLIAKLRDIGPTLIITGRIGQGGEDTGTLPYMLARALGLPIIADAVALSPGPEDGTLTVEQALPKGARRRVVVRLPALVTVHPAAPAPLPFAFAVARRGGIETEPGIAAQQPETTIEQRPYRKRPKLIASHAAGASAADRLRAATETASTGGKLLVHPAPEEAAREILSHLREIGVLR
ncbi:MAG TPA: electron transfer flavoprotein subunit beta [Ancylobacter sp.]